MNDGNGWIPEIVRLRGPLTEGVVEAVVVLLVLVRTRSPFSTAFSTRSLSPVLTILAPCGFVVRRRVLIG